MGLLIDVKNFKLFVYFLFQLVFVWVSSQNSNKNCFFFTFFRAFVRMVADFSILESY